MYFSDLIFLKVFTLYTLDIEIINIICSNFYLLLTQKYVIPINYIVFRFHIVKKVYIKIKMQDAHST